MATKTPSAVKPPKKPSEFNLWGRGIKFWGILVIAVIVLSLVIYLGSGYISAAKDSAKSSPQATEDKQSSYEQPKECKWNQLDFALTPPNSQVAPGANLEVKGSLKPRVSKPCYVVLKPGQLGIRIYSGSQVYWDSAQCPAAEMKKDLKLLLGDGITYNPTYVWSAKLYKGCEPMELAGQGTYQVVAVVDGKEQADKFTFTVK